MSANLHRGGSFISPPPHPLIVLREKRKREEEKKTFIGKFHIAIWAGKKENKTFYILKQLEMFPPSFRFCLRKFSLTKTEKLWTVAAIFMKGVGGRMKEILWFSCSGLASFVPNLIFIWNCIKTWDFLSLLFGLINFPCQIHWISLLAFSIPI